MPLYAGTVLIPVSVLIGILGNVVLPYLGFSTVRVPAGALLPLAGWIIPVLGLVMIAPPDGDVLVPAGGGPEYVYYALVLLGGAAGVTTFVRSAGAVRVR